MQAKQSLCHLTRISSLQTNDGTKSEEVKDFKYLGAWMESTAKDIKQRKAAAWRACSKLVKIWKSSLPRRFKLRLFAATVESVLLYGCEAWTTTPKNRKAAWWLLHTHANVHWKQHKTDAELYDKLSRISQKIWERRTIGLLDTASEVRSLFQTWFSGHQNMETRNLVDQLWHT